ncbi:DUF5107 domain-containing protein [Microbacterium sp. G2-8]|uniref:DUF5107 domain-containing protein n=1 Tax=Microbacterium sp. G2-8 TaxID=2842454 RepID=UPI001C8A515A|nr:DUF5107 domain-containing protein [Microbacterium sp. G2-8]
MTDTPLRSEIHLPDAPADQAQILADGGVACWSEPVTIDTYDAGDPDPYPLFLHRRVYQGSSGRIYPLPMVDSVSHAKRPRRWKAIHLENAYVRLMLLPEIGGRIHIGYDKVAGEDFLYRNNVIKPALVGLAGPWISGGIEFNWPQHHRPGTFLPVPTRIVRDDNGSVVVWHSDLDPLQRMRGTHGVRLRPRSSAIELDVALHNRTDVTQTFLWWANVAAPAHERYQSFFPDDVRYVADHARRAITAFPHADRPYYGVDYPALARESAGADRIDFVSRLPVPSSYMITDTDDEFFGGYDHDRDAGFVHWADRSVSPGKKQWTWGDGAIGRAWDAQLTDDDGPYVELMAGVFTDNQPDFSWLLPGETKRFRQLWFPIHATGPVRQAAPEGAIGVRADDDGLRITAISTRPMPGAVVEVLRDGEPLARWTHDLAPDAVLSERIDADGEDGLTVTLRHRGAEIVRWVAREVRPAEPWVATAPAEPAQIPSADELHITATHLEQYRHPSRSPVPYLREALRRDPEDPRASRALGAWHLRRGEYAEARACLETAVSREMRRNLNPRDGEACYLLALVCERQGDLDAADRWFGKAAWSAAWAAPARLGRARIALREGRAAAAAALAEEARGIPEAARIALIAAGPSPDAVQRAFDQDPLDPALAAWVGETAVDARALLDVGAEFARLGAVDTALAVTDMDVTGPPAAGLAGPIRAYLRAHWRAAIGDDRGARAERRVAREADPTLAFPAGLDQYDALQSAHDADPGDPVAASLLGMWLLDAGRTDDALRALQDACAAGGADPVTWRNLAIARAECGDVDGADAAYARALGIRPDARLLFERDVLAAGRGVGSADRLALLEEHEDALAARDDLAVRHIELLLDAGRVEDAERVLATRAFRPFEGGEGRVIAAFDRAQCARAAHLMDSDPVEAAALLEAGIEPPSSLGEGRHPADVPVERFVRLGDARMAAGERDPARDAWWRAVARTPLAVDPRPAGAHTFWEGVAHLRLGEGDASAAAWERLTRRAADLRGAGDAVDHFETSHPELAPFTADTALTRSRRAAELDELAARGRALQEGRNA